MNEAQAQPVENESGATREVRLTEKMTVLVGKLEALADEQVRKKVAVEDRWLVDLRQFHGKYDEDTIAKLKAASKSQIYVNMTRNKVNAWEARLSDMLFPTDDKNWGIKPTPAPELSKPLNNQDQAARDLMKQVEDAAKAMETEIEDQMIEARYNIKCREAIHNSCVLGTGIIKGPLSGGKMKQQWKKDLAGEYGLQANPDPRADWQHVDPWNYFPDMNARNNEEKEFEFERHLLNKKQMRKLARKPGFNRESIREVLGSTEPESLPNYVQQVKAIIDTGEALEARYHVWEFHGSIDGDDMETLCECLGKEEMLEDFELDPLEEIPVIIWFCNGHLLKFGLHPLDSGDTLYSVFNLEKDDSSVFGFGVPYMMRDSQKSLNGAWRMIMDNSALSTGPQIVINDELIEPENGSYNLTPRKIWRAKLRNGQGLDHAFKAYHIDGRQAELINVISLAKQFADDETNLPLVAQGESGSHQTQTAQGMSMLMNSVNVVFRRVVKNFDDDMTTPNIRRSYDWNMQFSNKDEIKGDFEVDARGSSVLLVREVQAQNLMVMATTFTSHPALGPITKTAELYRALAQAHMLSANKFIMTDEEIEEAAQQQAEQEPPPDPNILKLELQERIERMRLSANIEIENMRRDSQMMQLAEQKNMQLEDLRTKLGMKQIDVDSKERIFASEAALKDRHGEGI